ncbi:succinate dehydrogenase [Neisseria zalophi]|uniref:Succinate dehydrogenase n=1 Tax=Neisseria zalophi TaxID=640030 RepID=A0A5J6PWS4_9NEIS|nr:succinate dehydrogenase [Neisseria zalophi]QEY25332.1 succinate dehydrogenase [Neisseria zalophi]
MIHNKNKLGIYLSAIYGVIALIILGGNTEGSWDGFILFILAIPFSFLSIFITHYLNNILGNILFVFLNMLWWYFVGWLFTKIIHKKI